MNAKELMLGIAKNILNDKYLVEFKLFPNGCGLVISNSSKGVTMAVSDVELIEYRGNIHEHLSGKIKNAVYMLERRNDL